jgi:hypothetical protein
MARLFSARTLVLGGLAVAAAAALKNKRKAAALIGSQSSTPEPYQPPSTAPVGAPSATPGEPAPAPAVSNFDAPGPPENTATPVPAPDPQVHEPEGGIDEAAEEEAAAAEAGNIGGPDPVYADSVLDEPAEAEVRPLAEAGEGVSEGQEQAELDLQDNAEPAAGDPVEGGRAIDDAIEAQDQPATGESTEDGETLAATTAEDGAPTTGGTLSGLAGSPEETPAAEKSANVWRKEDGPEDQPTVEQEKLPDEGGSDKDDGSEWQTWSGRAVEP